MPDHTLVVQRIRSIPEYRTLFRQAFPGDPEAVSFDNMAQAIADFERQLVTYSPFDRYLAGDETSLSLDAKNGLRVFLATGCAACHSGPAVGGGGFSKMGSVTPYENTTDAGRFEVTKRDQDQFGFKTAILRNIERTYPYFHDGSVWSLEEAVQKMARRQLGVRLAPDQVQALIAFLHALTGEVPVHLRTLPQLPPSALEAPRPLP